MNMSKFLREYQMKLKQDHRRSLDSKRTYETRCSEEILSSQIFHKEMARHGKSSREAEKVLDILFQSLSNYES